MILSLYKALLAVIEVANLLLLISAALLSPVLRAFKRSPPRLKCVRNKTVLITGAGHGIGREMAIRFARHQAITVLFDLNEEFVRETADIISRECETKTFWFVVDVSDERQVEEAASQVRTKIGDVDILVNNAGIAPCEPFKELTSEKIRRVFDVNILAHFWTIKQFLPAMERNNRGHIVAIASSAGIMGSPYFTAYGASKHAVVGFMKSLYEEMDVNSSIKLTTICPLGISGTGIDIPTKTRFPFLLPIMTLEYAVEHIFESILREEELVVLPYTFKWIYRFISIFPMNIASSIWKCLDYEVVPKGVYAPIGRAHYYDRINRKNSMIRTRSNSVSNNGNNQQQQQQQLQLLQNSSAHPANAHYLNYAAAANHASTVHPPANVHHQISTVSTVSSASSSSSSSALNNGRVYTG